MMAAINATQLAATRGSPSLFPEREKEKAVLQDKSLFHKIMFRHEAKAFPAFLRLSALYRKPEEIPSVANIE